LRWESVESPKQFHGDKIGDIALEAGRKKR